MHFVPCKETAPRAPSGHVTWHVQNVHFSRHGRLLVLVVVCLLLLGHVYLVYNSILFHGDLLFPVYMFSGILVTQSYGP